MTLCGSWLRMVFHRAGSKQSCHQRRIAFSYPIRIGIRNAAQVAIIKEIREIVLNQWLHRHPDVGVFTDPMDLGYSIDCHNNYEFGYICQTSALNYIYRKLLGSV